MSYHMKTKRKILTRYLKRYNRWDKSAKIWKKRDKTDANKNLQNGSNHLFMSKLISLIKCLPLSRYKVPSKQTTNVYFLCLMGTKNCIFCVLRRINKMYRGLSSNFTMLLWIRILDSEPPVLTFCPGDILIDNATEVRMRIYWQQPYASDNSGVPPKISSQKQPDKLCIRQ